MQNLKEKLLKLFIVFSLFFPVCYSTFSETYKMEYYMVFTAAYGVLLIYMLVQLWRGERIKGQRFVLASLSLLVVYNLLSFYMNTKYLHWYGEQINNTVAFLFFIFLCWYQNSLGEREDNLIVFFIRCTVVSNLLSIVYFFLGYNWFAICNNQLFFTSLPEDYYEFRHYWIYSHKSDYALFLVAFMAVCIRFRDKFKNKWTFLLSLSVLLAALFLSHSWTGFGAAVLIFAGGFLDTIHWKKLKFKKIYLLWGGMAAAVAAVAGKLLMAERNIFTLGGRVYIWQGAINQILKTPQGLGYQFAEILFEVPNRKPANNAHHVFLNALLRFSIPVGICFTVLFLVIVIYSLVKSKSWLSVGMWAAFIILMSMDYSLMNYEVGMLLFVVYLVCIYKPRRKEEEYDGVVETADA